MKIIKSTKIDNWSHKITCSTCDSELEVELEDIKHHHYDGDQRDPPYDRFYVTCPVCKVECIVPSNNLPKLAQIKIKERTQRHSTNYFDR